MSKPHKAEVFERRKKVKELILQGVTDTKELANCVGVSTDTILGDMNAVNAYYAKLALNNPHIAERQHARMMKLHDEIDLIKKEYWTILDDLKSSKEIEFKTQIDQLENCINYFNSIADQLNIEAYHKNVEKIRGILFFLKLRKKPNTTNKLETLKSLVKRIDSEAKLMNLFNPQSIVVNNYITIDKFKEITMVVKEIINEFVPPDKRKYAYERLSKIEVSQQSGEEILDAELVG